MRRRDVLLGGVALGGAAALGGWAAIVPRSAVQAPFGSGDRERPEAPRRVVIVGGGLAGMACAAVLGRRGYAVTLCERGSALGGKLSGWPITVGGETVPMEHGFHGFFRQYYNLRALLAEAGADRDLVTQVRYPILFRDRPTEAFRGGALPFPLDLVEVLARSPGLTLADVAGDRPGMRELLAYDPVATFARWDGLDVEAFIREGRLDGAFTDLVLRPFGQASMNALARFSAAELVRFFHFYMLGNPEGLGFDALGRGVHESVLGPLRAHLERLGVVVRTGAAVARVRVADGRAVGVELEGGGGEELRVPVSAIPEAGWATLADGRVFVRRGPAGYDARDARCTHLGCPVSAAVDGFVCPCHAGRYDLDGRPVAGPPPRPLRALVVTEDRDELVLRAEGPSAEVLPADAVVLATEVRGFRELVRRSELADVAPTLVRAAEAAGEADPYAVARFWFDRPARPDRAAFYTVADYEWTDSLALYSTFQAPYTAGSNAVVESHAYGIEPERVGGVDRYRDALLAELRVALPELRDATVVHEEVLAQSNFTRFAPGDWARRPTVHTELPNLFVAGDHVALPFPAFLMEAAVASGRLAANRVCAADGVREEPVRTVALRGPLAAIGPL